MVRAKFVVQSVTTRRHWQPEKAPYIQEIELSAVAGQDGGEENKKFFEATPSGVIKFGTLNPEAAAQFQPGQAFYVDFTPAD